MASFLVVNENGAVTRVFPMALILRKMDITAMPKSVLVIDDDETFCEFLVEILKRKGFQVTATTDGLAGHAMAVQDPYDLAIIDVRMPGVLGTELAERLKKEKPQLKVILISAFADEPLARTAADLGATLVSKPFSADRLYEVIKTTYGVI